jgi:hypothetical protein
MVPALKLLTLGQEMIEVAAPPRRVFPGPIPLCLGRMAVQTGFNPASTSSVVIASTRFRASGAAYVGSAGKRSARGGVLPQELTHTLYKKPIL